MNCCLKLFGVFSILAAILFGLGWQKLTAVPDIPTIETEYWGSGVPKPDDKAIKPFKISVSEDVLNDLNGRLGNATSRLAKPLEGVGFEYGMNTVYLGKILKYWKNEYKWKEREVFLNKYPQFKTQIGGLNMHFIRVKPDAKKAEGKTVLPLLLLHGWPGSVREFYTIIPLLTTPRQDYNFVFEVIIPSLPGYGFSEGAARPGLGPAQMGALFNDLMIRLGFNKYYVQGGDWGSLIGKTMSILFPDRVLAYHSNMCTIGSKLSYLQMIVASIYPPLLIESHKQEEYPDQFSNLMLETGYFHIQATKPDTVGVALSDSPAGLAAYIIEKFSTWTNKNWRSLPDGGLEHYDKAALLDNVMIYWITNSITTSVRLYSEAFSRAYRSLDLESIPVTVPTACARFNHEIAYISTSMLTPSFLDLVQVTDYPKGGHFAAFEVPELLADDIWRFIKTVTSRKPKKEKADL